MNDTVKKFRSRRAERIGVKREDEKDPIARYRERRHYRLKKRHDENDHGNTHIPFGLCEREGIEVQAGWTPKDAWDALKEKGYDPDTVYKELEKTGKTPKGQDEHSAPDVPKKKAKFISAFREGWEHTALEYEYRGKRYWVTRHNNGCMDDSLRQQHEEAQAAIDEQIRRESEPIREQKYEGSWQEGFDQLWDYFEQE